MKKYSLSLLVVLVLITSCITQKRCDNRFPCHGSDSVAVITKTLTVYRDTTIYVYVPGKTVRDTVKLYVGSNGLLFSDKSKLFTSFAESWAWVENGKLMHELMQKDTLLARHIKNAIKETATVTESKKTNTVIKEVNKLTGWQWFQVWTGRILFLLLLIFIGWKKISGLLKFP